ncbi:MAG: SPOR domain-containing protein [Colwellia sp.]
MSTPFQNRLVGTIIVAAAIVIFLPDILDGKKKSYQAEFESIPQAPKFTGNVSQNHIPEKIVIVKPSKQNVEEIQAQDALLAKKSPNALNKPSTKIDEAIENSKDNVIVTPLIKEKPITKTVVKNTSSNTQPEKAVNKEAWVIHLGSFKHKKNVEELLAKLKRNGYVAFTKPIKTKQGNLTKVFIGPELIKSSLTKKLPKLKKLTNVQGKVARFYPTKY